MLQIIAIGMMISYSAEGHVRYYLPRAIICNIQQCIMRQLFNILRTVANNYCNVLILGKNSQADIKRPIYYFPNVLLDSTDSENLCKEWGGHLPRIESQEENDFLTAQQRERYVSNTRAGVHI